MGIDVYDLFKIISSEVSSLIFRTIDGVRDEWNFHIGNFEFNYWQFILASFAIGVLARVIWHDGSWSDDDD